MKSNLKTVIFDNKLTFGEYGVQHQFLEDFVERNEEIDRFIAMVYIDLGLLDYDY